MQSPQYVVRGPKNEAEIAAFYDDEARGSRWDTAINGPLPDYQKLDTTSPGFQNDFFRLVFDGDKLIGGCLVGQRRVVVDDVALATGCVGGVFTHHQYRRQGIGRLLMDRVVAYSRARGDALLMLDGIPDYYHRWSYVDIIDLSHACVAVERINKLGKSSLVVREATVDDASAMLELYQRHHAGNTGRFVRDVTYQRYLVETTEYGNTYFRVVEGSDGRPSGYSFHSRRYPNRGLEVVASDWESLSALLHDHIASLPADHQITELRLAMPPDSREAMMLADHLSVRQETIREPDEDWMARVVNLDRIVAAMSPVWSRRWQDVSGPDRLVDVRVGEATIRFGPECAELIARVEGTTSPIELTEQAFTQLLFGFRPAAYLATLPGNTIPAESIDRLAVLFPTLPTWIAATDYF